MVFLLHAVSHRYIAQNANPVMDISKIQPKEAISAQQRLLSMTPAQKRQARQEESKLLAKEYAQNPDQVSPDFHDELAGEV